MEMLSGAEMVIRSLQDEGVDYIYGYPGGSVLHIYDALFQQDKVKHVLVRHEQAATHMADAYARASGKPGVVLVTSGPGATNAVTGIATAYMDSIPMVVISGQVMSHLIGEDAFQETDILGVSRPVVKHNFAVKDPKDIPETIKKAFYVASSGYPDKVEMRSYNPATRGHSGQIKKAMDMLLAAKRPVILVGGGTIGGRASEEVIELARQLNYPVSTTLMGLGGFPASDRQWLGMPGMHGSYEANMALHHSDLILSLGARFDDRVTNSTEKFCPTARVIHVDIDPSSISKTIAADVPIVGPTKSVATEMLALLAKSKTSPDADAIASWWEQIDQWRERHGGHYDINEDGLLKPQQVIEAVHKITNGDAYVCSDVGQHQMYAAQYYKFDKPNRWINSGGLGTMGFGFPAAMGVKLHYPEAEVVCVTGEGSFQMNLQEFSTCSQYGLPVKIVCLNNQSLGMVRQWQDMNYESRHSQSYMQSLPDFEALARSYGHEAVTINNADELEAGLEKAFAMKDKLVFINVYVDPTEHVYPMQVPKASMRDMWLSKTERT